MDQELGCRCCGEVKLAAAFVPSRLAQRQQLCRACLSLRNKRYFAANRHVFLAGLSRRALRMPDLTVAKYCAVLAKHGNQCVVSKACGETVPPVLVRVAEGSTELVPVVRRLATRCKWLLQRAATNDTARRIAHHAQPPVPALARAPAASAAGCDAQSVAPVGAL